VTRTGVDNPWRPEDEPDRDPEPLAEWIQAGIPVEEAEIWRNWRYRIAKAAAWRRAGVLGGLQAAQWSTAGVTPQTVERWRAAAIDATEAVNWHELGFTLEQAARHKTNGLSPSQAFDRQQSAPGPIGMSVSGGTPIVHTAVSRHGFGGRPGPPPDFQKFLEAGVPPPVLNSYMTRQWVDDDAVSWAKEGIDAADAQLWKELGLQAAEAGRLTRQGATVSQTVREWWQAGIPIDEVADWIGAGLKPQEAADQRARGITAQQAATLRALREGPD
jgi:hypothetical protein